MVQRQAEWAELVAQGLAEFGERLPGMQRDELAGSERFVALWLLACEAAGQTPQREKRRALCNVVLHAALTPADDDETPIRCIHLIGRLPVESLRLLRWFDDPRAWAAQQQISVFTHGESVVEDILIKVFPALRGQRDRLPHLYEELATYGLIERFAWGLRTRVARRELLMARTTTFGQMFVDFMMTPRVEQFWNSVRQKEATR